MISKAIRKQAVFILWVSLSLMGPGGVSAASLADIWQAAIQAHLSKNYAKSLRLLDQYLERQQDPDKIAAAQFFQAENYNDQGKHRAALALYRSLAVSGPNGPLKISARYREAEFAYNQSDFAEALKILNKLAGDSQADFLFPQIPLAQVKSNLKLRKIKQARSAFEHLLEKYPRSLLDPEIKFLYGINKEYQGKDIDALKIYEELQDNPLARLFAGAILESQGRYLEAIEAYNAVLDIAEVRSYREMTNYFKIRAFYKSGDVLSAERLCNIFFSAFPRSEFRGKVSLFHLLVLQAQARFSEVLDLHTRYAHSLEALSPLNQSLLNFTLAEASLNLDRYQEALTLYAQALPKAGKHQSEIHLKMACVNLQVSNWDKAHQAISDYFRSTREPKPLAFVVAVRANLAIGREQSAFRRLETLSQGDENLAELGLYFLAAHHQARDNPRQLVNQWVLLEKHFSRNNPRAEFREAAAWARLMIAEAYFREENIMLARQYYRQALEFYPHGRAEIDAYTGLTWCSFQLRDYTDVLSKSRRLFDLPKVPGAIENEISLLRAHASFNLQEYDKAIRSYQKWLKASPQHPAVPTVRFQIGWAYYLKQAYLDAVETWKALARDYPKLPETQEALFWTADTYFQAGENAEARKVYQELLAKYPDTEKRQSFELRVAQTYYNEQKDTIAIRRYTAILEKYPKTPEAEEATLGIETASYRITDQMDTIPAFREFIEIFPESNLAEDIQYRIGEAYYFKGQYQDSLREFLQFVLKYTKSPRTPQAQYYLAVCQEQLGNTLETVLQAQAFVNNYPQHELAPEMMFRLASAEFQMERYAEAAGHFVACADNYELQEYQPRAWYNAAVTYEKIQLPEKALQYYEKLVTAYPQDPKAEVSFSRMVMMNALRRDDAGIEKTLILMEAKASKELLQKTWLQLAVLYQEQEKELVYENMLIKIMDEGLAHTQDYSLALVELAALYEERKDWASALKIYRRLAQTTSEKKWRQAATKRIKLLKRILKSQ